MESTRVDKWLCAVRVFKTRALATDACEGGHVTVNDRGAKPATPVRVGDRVGVRIEHADRILEVVRIIDKRVGASVAAECLVDHSPVVEREPYVPVFARDAGAGRPTKRDRRILDRSGSSRKTPPQTSERMRSQISRVVPSPGFG